jgi:uncharacterized protein YigA (DUF484 family)
MTGGPELDPDIRETIIADPEVLLQDRDIMRALAETDTGRMGNNVVDIRGLALDRLEDRLDRLEDTHRSVIAAAYDNLAGTNQTHRAVLALLEAPDFAAFLACIEGDVADIMGVDAARLILESHETADAASDEDGVIALVEDGFLAEHLGAQTQARPVSLRQIRSGHDRIYGDRAPWLRSEAVMRVDLGQGRLPAALCFASEDPHKFKPTQGTDLLAFFAGVFERSMRNWLG